MKVRVTVHGKRSATVTLMPQATVISLMRKMGLGSDLYIPSIGGKAVPTDHPLKEGDDVLLIGVVSGG